MLSLRKMDCSNEANSAVSARKMQYIEGPGDRRVAYDRKQVKWQHEKRKGINRWHSDELTSGYSRSCTVWQAGYAASFKNLEFIRKKRG